MKIICIGDSLTFGNVGYSYIHFLNKKFQTINKGKNGDTLKGVYARIKKMMEKSKYNSEIYVLGVGTNDVFLPYLRGTSLFWFLFMSLRCKIKKCIEDHDVFYQEYDKLLNVFFTKNKQVIIFGMPFINLKNFPHEILTRRNDIIKELAEKYNYPFIDIYKLQMEKISKDSRVYTWKYKFLIRVLDGFIMTIFPLSKDWFAKFRGLTTTVDGAHFSSKSAVILAEEVEKNIPLKTNLQKTETIR